MEQSPAQNAQATTPALSRSEALADFTRSLQAIHDPDFGDFKRKATLYVHRLMEHLGTDHAPSKKILVDMVYLLNYEPNTDLDKTRFQLLDMANELGKTH